MFFIQEIIVSYEGEVCGEEGSFPICARGRRNSSALNVLGDQRKLLRRPCSVLPVSCELRPIERNGEKRQRERDSCLNHV